MTSIRRTPLHTATVVTATDLTPRMRRITVAATTLVDLDVRPAQDVELVLAEASGRRVKRRYTIRNSRPDTGEWDLDVLLHRHDAEDQGGPGSTWGATAATGDAVSFFGPRGKLVPTDVPWSLFLGDESSLPAIAGLIESMPATTADGKARAATALVEVDSAEDELAIHAPAGVALDLRWVHRDGAAPGSPDLLSAALAHVTPPSDGTGHAYLLGESRSVVALRGELERVGIGYDDVFTKGYWNLTTGR